MLGERMKWSEYYAVVITCWWTGVGMVVLLLVYLGKGWITYLVGAILLAIMLIPSLVIKLIVSPIEWGKE
jgi:hypothetical protein